MDNDTDTTYDIFDSVVARVQVTSTESDGSTAIYQFTIYTGAKMSTVASSSSSKQMEVNPRGIPKAPFVVCPSSARNSARNMSEEVLMGRIMWKRMSGVLRARLIVP
jgi:hypothetical protein